jgi:hypothetical protein
MNWQAALSNPALMAAIVAGGGSALQPSPDKGRMARFFMNLAAGLGVAAALLFLAGGYIWLERAYDSQFAILVIASAAAMLAVMTGGVAFVLLNYRRLKMRAYQRDITKRIESVTNAILDEFEIPVRAYPKTAVAVAAFAGWLASEKMQGGTEQLMRLLEEIRNR